MKQLVFIVKQEIEYEGFTIEAVYHDEAKAKAHVDVENKKIADVLFNLVSWDYEEHEVLL